MQRLSLADVGANYRTASDVAGAALETRKRRIDVGEADRKIGQRKLLDSVVRKHTVIDPETGQAATDHDGVAADLYRMDTELAKAYEADVLATATAAQDLSDKREKSKREGKTWEQGQYDRNIKMLAEALANVNEKGDQTEAKAAYDAEIARLEAQGVPIDDSDRVYSPGRVAFMRRKVIGAQKLFEAETKEKELTTKEGGLDRRAVLASQTTLTAAQMRENGADRRHATPSGSSLATAAAGRGTGVGGLTKQGEISLRTDPRLKKFADVDFDALITDLDRVDELIRSGGAKTGPGTGLSNAIDRAGLAADAFLGRGKANPATWFNRRFAPNGAEDRAAAFELIDKLSTKEGIAALAGIGGNDTDKDFDRALKTTVGNLRTKQFNMETLTLTREFAKLAKAKRDFVIQWANEAGSPLATLNGRTMDQTWALMSQGEQKRIAAMARQAGLVGKAKTNVPPGKTPGRPPQAPAGSRTVRRDDGSYWFQNLKTGDLKRAS